MTYNDPMGEYKRKKKLMTDYRGMCGRCLCRPATSVHEIVPKSQTPDWDRPENQIPLCTACHDTVHTDTDRFTPELYAAQARARDILNPAITIGGNHG